MTTINDLETLVVLAHADVLANLECILFTHPDHVNMKARRDVYAFFGRKEYITEAEAARNTMTDLYKLTWGLTLSQRALYRPQLIVAIASASPLETIQDACRDYQRTSHDHA